MRPHTPVLLEEVLHHLDLKKGDILLDGTIGFAGHSDPFLKTIGPSGRLIGCDQDKDAITYCQSKFKSDKNVSLYNTNYSTLFSILKDKKITLPNKILIDLGFSSFQLDQSERGFSFLKDEPLDMRMDIRQSETAATILNSYSKENLSNLFFNLGELYKNKILSENIVIERKKNKLTRTSQLLDIIKKSYFFSNNRKQYMKINSQVFQALRIEVNQEFEHMLDFFKQAIEILPLEGRIAIITFHSTEDRLVKKFFKPLKNRIEPVHKKVVQASQDEITKNLRSKSAKLRTYIKTTQ